ncbi:MATE family efflux transporter [Amphritea sp. 1_MG-2023]|uniref:MATE family efflux transporter n=1 Tax=Amphritea sp. 1_MG-2023 TaxID=3062670 RepID=UPI0026E1E707|nr:MATE family efflux transporter [Amphritea sp. 1_MG-2023]MDO6562337.1 MATE family efflux transporter [Amphritea sp. 1_MG-2023]
MIHYLKRAHKQDHQQVWSLAWPMILSNITVPLLGLVDTAVIGHLPDPKYLGAVAVGAMIFTILYWSCGFLRMGTTGMTAQALGNQAYDQSRLILAQSLIVAGLIGLCMLILQYPILEIALNLIDAEPSVTVEARLYADIRIFGAPAVLANYTLLGWFLGNQNTRIPLMLLVFTNLLNMVLDIIAVYGLEMHADGVAFATVISEYASLMLGCFFMFRMQARQPGTTPWLKLKSVSHYYRLINVNRYLFVRTLALLLTMAFFTSQGAKQGTTILSANAVLLNFVMLISNGLDGFAHAAEALSGKYYGAKDNPRFHRIISACLSWSLVSALLMTLFFWLGGEFIIALLTDIPAIRQTAADYLAWVIILPLIAVWSYLLDGVFVGTTRVKAMQNTMLISVLGVFAPLWYVSQPWGNNGLWLAFLSLFVARGLTGGYVFFKEFKPPRD